MSRGHRAYLFLENASGLFLRKMVSPLCSVAILTKLDINREGKKIWNVGEMDLNSGLRMVYNANESVKLDQAD